jgi:hypothetical protein
MSIPLTGRKPQKSVKLKPNEVAKLMELREQANSDTDLAFSFVIDRITLLRIITVGSGSEINIRKIRRKLSRLNQKQPA